MTSNIPQLIMKIDESVFYFKLYGSIIPCVETLITQTIQVFDIATSDSKTIYNVLSTKAKLYNISSNATFVIKPLFIAKEKEKSHCLANMDENLLFINSKQFGMLRILLQHTVWGLLLHTKFNCTVYGTKRKDKMLWLVLYRYGTSHHTIPYT